jgi:hypothetical protein
LGASPLRWFVGADFTTKAWQVRFLRRSVEVEHLEHFASFKGDGLPCRVGPWRKYPSGSGEAPVEQVRTWAAMRGLNQIPAGAATPKAALGDQKAEKFANRSRRMSVAISGLFTRRRSVCTRWSLAQQRRLWISTINLMASRTLGGER